MGAIMNAQIRFHGTPSFVNQRQLVEGLPCFQPRTVGDLLGPAWLVWPLHGRLLEGWSDGPCLTKGGIAAWIARSSVETVCTSPALLADAFLGVILGIYAVYNRPAGCALVLEPFLPARLSSQ